VIVRFGAPALIATLFLTVCAPAGDSPHMADQLSASTLDAGAPSACAAVDPTRRHRIQMAILGAGEWLAAFPPDRLHFDAAVGLWHIRQRVYSQPMRAAWRRAREIADRDGNNPLRRFWDASLVLPADVTSSWDVPQGSGERVDPDRVIAEALYCADNGWRPETSRYIAGPMRDGGGDQTAHALWALSLAETNGCLREGEYLRVAPDLQQELRDHQPSEFDPETTLDIELYAERILMLLLTGDDGTPIETWLDTLITLQNDDGGWGIERSGDNRYALHRATVAAVWALSLWPEP